MGMLFAATLCATPQQAHAGKLTHAAAQTISLMGKGLKLTAELTFKLGFTGIELAWEYKSPLTILLVSAYISHVATLLSATNKLSFTEAYNLVSSHFVILIKTTAIGARIGARSLESIFGALTATTHFFIEKFFPAANALK